MSIARATASVSTQVVAPVMPNTPHLYPSKVEYPVKAKPVTPAEQYWAARALTAEALLSVKTAHHEEMRVLAVEGETRRTVRVVHHAHLVSSLMRELAG